MIDSILKLAHNPILQIMMVGVFTDTALAAVVMATIEVPPDAILTCGLQEVLLVFEG